MAPWALDYFCGRKTSRIGNLVDFLLAVGMLPWTMGLDSGFLAHAAFQGVCRGWAACRLADLIAPLYAAKASTIR